MEKTGLVTEQWQFFVMNKYGRSNGLRLIGWTCNVFEKEPVQMNLKHFYKESHHKFRWCHSVAVLFWKKDANACAGRDLISGIHPWNPKMETPKCQSLKGLHINFKSRLFFMSIKTYKHGQTSLNKNHHRIIGEVCWKISKHPPQKMVRDRYIAAAAGDYRLGVNFLPSDEAKVKAWKKTPILGGFWLLQ